MLTVGEGGKRADGKMAHSFWLYLLIVHPPWQGAASLKAI
jgi:hypothetical protein